ncbi:VanW family protein [Aestuariivirga sp.]|uniref:VanW family protein n=1 Tax=Aestuariivirga sp. TaxID=2650926 RepID=UPI0039E2E072
MKQALPKPLKRSALRLALGRLYYVNKRRLSWYLSSTRFATERSQQQLPHMHMQHGTPMLRELSGVDMTLQRNKMASLKIAAACIDGVILKPGETFSFWRMVGKPSLRRGFKVGFVLKNGKLAEDVGGGLCQMTNLIYWMTIHTDLEVVERWRHGFDVFPDAGRTQPFASGATCAYNYIDLQIRNPTTDTYQLNVWQKNDWLRGAWRCSAPQKKRYEIFEMNHEIRPEWWGGYSRHNELWRRARDAVTAAPLGEEFITANHAIMMYEPLLPAPAPEDVSA